MQQFLVGVGVTIAFAPLVAIGWIARLVVHGLAMGWNAGGAIVRAARQKNAEATHGTRNP